MKRRRSTFVVVMVALVVAGCASAGGPAARAQGGGPATVSTQSGVYADEQAALGMETYKSTCVACHTPGGHSGEDFSRVWENRSAFELFDMISTEMPGDNPGSLTRKQYIELVAYLFKLNGYPAGREPLVADREVLQQIRIEGKGPSRR